MAGLILSEDDAMKLSEDQFPGKPKRLVRDWVWVDVSGMPKGSRESAEYSVIYANDIVFDEAGRFQAGDSCRSTFMSSYQTGLFETQDTIYVLLGVGMRVGCDIDTLLNIQSRISPP